MMAILNSIEDPGRLADLIASNLRMPTEIAQSILECLDPVKRLELVNKQLMKEVEVAILQNKIQQWPRREWTRPRGNFS